MRIDSMLNKKINWRVYERDHLYPQSISAYLDLITTGPSKSYPYIANYYEVMSYCKDYFWWARDADALEMTMRRWASKWLYNKHRLSDLLSLFKKSHKEIIYVIPRLKRVSVRGINDRELYSLYQQTKDIFFRNIVFSEYTVDLIDDFLGKIFNEYLQKLSGNRISETDLSDLMQPAYVSAGLSYKNKVLKLSFLKNISQNILEKIVDRFSWIIMSWDGRNELTVQHFLRDIKKMQKQNTEVRLKELEKIKNFIRYIKKRRTQLLKKYKLPPRKISPYFSLIDTFAKLHDWRKETQMRCNQIIFHILKEMSRRFKVIYRDLLLYFNQEIKDLCLFKRKVLISEIEERRKGITFIIHKGKIKKFFGVKAKKILERLVLSVVRTRKTSKVSGISANKGKTQGRAFVVKSAKEAFRIMKKRGVLITSMTTIDYLPAVRLAAAIVTDDGGITCHAAIISRELGKPCIVGTKISTQIFKTGDLVEVDADKGVVKKIQ